MFKQRDGRINGGIVTGALISYALYKLDDEFGISESIINALKSKRPNKPVPLGHPQQMFTTWGLCSRGF